MMEAEASPDGWLVGWFMRTKLMPVLPFMMQVMNKSTMLCAFPISHSDVHASG